MEEQVPNTTNGAAGDPRSTTSTVLETGAAATQDFSPIKSICAHLNAFHVYASDPARCVEANHYCTHLNEGSSSRTPPTPTPYPPLSPLPNPLRPARSTNPPILRTDVRQCLIYDTPHKGARLIGIEYMVSPRVFATLPPEERRLWHSHVFEVKSGLLIMPQPTLVPRAVWETAETSEMQQVVGLYGKTYHLWQVDRGDVVPMGAPELMMSFTGEEQLAAKAQLVRERDERFGTEVGRKREIREGVEEPVIEAGEWG
ncbi:hypothetical protein MMC17_009677 [Xylographa soralifera]|nr:hypothetical protein [Xylographa soralifera]